MVRPVTGERITKIDTYLNCAEVFAYRSTCIKRKYGAVIVKDDVVISTGYNGTPRGVRNCSDGGCPRCNSDAPSGSHLTECLCSHAEENAIVQAAYHGIMVKGATLYTTYSPCLLCAKMIINAGIVEVVYHERYSIDSTSMALLSEAGVKVRPVSDEEVQ
mgnify:CR=1 FL=1